MRITAFTNNPSPTGEPIEVFKHDARSRVWSTESGGRTLIIKRFEYAPWRQRLVLLAGLHPAQREVRGNARLAAAGVPVVPLVGGGIDGAGPGCRVWLATEPAGRSLRQRIVEDPAGSDRYIDLAAALGAMLVAARLRFRDFKPGNIVIDDDGVARFIDAGSVRPGLDEHHLSRMLAVMDRTLARIDVAPAPRRRLADTVRAAARPSGA